ncbi:Ftsk gamma domain-containing protein [Bartonella apis]|uniref:DNA translocase FtsK n=1 Tax=Bartonella apis TaxID=1686310 RepID=UPI0009661826|nr:Ftsk gamma domain-containing protein [Bartonella apis]
MPQSSLSAMRNLKTNPVSLNPVAKPVSGATAKPEEAVASAQSQTQYPTIWKKAFALGQNVRFTRTPEVELVRKRVENDPDFAEKLKAFELEQKQKRENVALKENAPENKEPVTLDGTTPLPQGQTQVRSLQDEVIASVKRKNIEQNYSVKSVYTRPQNSGAPQIRNETSMQEAAVEVEKPASEINKPADIKPFYLSDSAFFECGPDILENLAKLTPQNESEPQSVETPLASANTIVPETSLNTTAPETDANAVAVEKKPVVTVQKMSLDGSLTSGASQLPPVASTLMTGNTTEEKSAAKVEEKSIADLYRVLECRFPKKSGNGPEKPTGKVEEKIEQQVATPDIVQPTSTESGASAPVANDATVQTPETSEAAGVENTNAVIVDAAPQSIINQTAVTESVSLSSVSPAITPRLTETPVLQVVTPLPDNSVVTTFNNQGQVVIENAGVEKNTENTAGDAQTSKSVGGTVSQAASQNPVSVSPAGQENSVAPSAGIIEDIEPIKTANTQSAAALPQAIAPQHSGEEKAPEQKEKTQAVAPIATTEQTATTAQNATITPTATKATISAPFRTLNPAFIPSPKSQSDDSYIFPSIDLLQEPEHKDGAVISQETLERSAGLLESVLEDFGIKGEIIHVRPGPVVTMYEFEPAAGVKSSRVIGLSDDIARSMSAISARVAVIPGRNVIGIELPNKVRETVYLREIIQSKTFQDSNYKLPLALGKNIGGEPVIAELAKMPHLLVAGTTGSGKSVAINAMILSLLYRLKPEQCRLIMVDPKMLELSIYDGIPHLLTPVVTDPKKAVTALKWAVREMEDRYRKMAKLGVRNIDGFNQRVSAAAEKGETITCRVQSGFDKETGEMLYHEEAMDLTRLPYIVIIVDEMADLMMVAGKEIEGAIQRLAQMARAAGIHLIMATQRPSVDVITGTIKANFPTRISFQVTSKIDSRTILGEQGAETLLGQGDMLHMVGGGRIVRVHGPFVSDEEVEHVVAHLKTQGTPDYLATVTDGEDEEETIEDADSIADIVAAGSAGENMEELYLQAVKVVMRDKKCSTSYIQRRLSIGYNKAATLVERMEAEGIVGPANHVGKREILLNHGHEL